MKTTKLFTLLMALAVMTFTISSCKDDDPVIDVVEGLRVGDGYYITQAGVDPVNAQKLSSETVEDVEFGAQEREGFFGGYVFLEAGDYNVVNVETKAITATYGGAAVAATEETKVCETLNYSVITSTEGGAAFAVATSGLYKVTYDEITGEIVYINVASAGIIGSATEIGWTDDKTVDLAGTISADGASWSASGVTLRQGEFKLRFNCSWYVDRRIEKTLSDPVALWGASNGYMLHTNFGGSTTALIHGNDGSGIQISEADGDAPAEGVFTVTATWNAEDGFAIALERTGDAEPLPEYPETMYMIGDALNMDDTDLDGTPDGWQWDLTDEPMNPVHSNPHLFWKIVWLETGGGFKFSPVAEWNGDFGVTGSATNGVYAKGGDNISAPATSGYYMVVVNLDTETIEVNEPTVYGIGDAFNIGDDAHWNQANINNLFTVDNANEVVEFANLPSSTNALRIHVAASTLTQFESTDAVEWWQAEFIVLSGNIEYRGTGDDQARAEVTVGQTVSLNFKAGTGTIE